MKNMNDNINSTGFVQEKMVDDNGSNIIITSGKTVLNKELDKILDNREKIELDRVKQEYKYIYDTVFPKQMIGYKRKSVHINSSKCMKILKWKIIDIEIESLRPEK